MRTAIYPGSFDPLTNGHLDIIERAAKLFDRVIVAVAKNESKHPLFTLKERLDLVRRALAGVPNAEADSFDGLLVDYAERRSGQAIIRGLRAVSDFEFEFQLALMNRKLNGRVETIFMMPRETYTFLSSRIVKEIACLGGNVDPFVPDSRQGGPFAEIRQTAPQSLNSRHALLMPLTINIRHVEEKDLVLRGRTGRGGTGIGRLRRIDPRPAPAAL